jgi:hypothetical protein
MVLRVSLRLFAVAFGLALAACHVNSDASSDNKPSAAPSASTKNMLTLNLPPPGQLSPRAPHPPVTHTISFADHLRVTELDTGDFIESPNDDAYRWSSAWKGVTVFEPVDGVPAGHVRFRAAKSGGAQLILDGDPKCLNADGGGCDVAKRQWTLFYVVH